ncbi:TraX family protein [Vagococcus vulneris]|uniref:Conjugal transfer protein TraX n=1 Tax=Vagococcus vulneris TaxID=1977869 RepID=A0A429ZWE1_9ENTE|nr:TraX family protein [Vagococcus vulneris]RST98104.1 hypothetical protein CBF37_08710 [Vagococcus vulneris]
MIESTNKKGLSSFSLKIIAIIFMTIDHVNSYLTEFLHLPLWISLLGRFVAPLFVFFLVEGYFYTKNKMKYFSRLFVGGILMTAINICHNLLTKSNFDNPVTGEFDVISILQGQNIFMTLAFIFLFIWSIDSIRSKKLSIPQIILHILGIILLIPIILMNEGGPYEIIVALIFYFFRGNFKKIVISMTIFCSLLLGKTLFTYFTIPAVGTLYQLLTFSNEFMMISVLPFIYLYNGKRGGSGKKWEKNLFYYFYPIHLIIIYVLRDLFLGVF